LVDKRNASLWVFRADGTLAGRTPVLLGADRGDATVPGVGERTQSGRLRADDRTTPAGPFISRPGFNNAGEAAVWVDYEAALVHGGMADEAGLRQQRFTLAPPSGGRSWALRHQACD
jgi:hypothetical protein